MNQGIIIFLDFETKKSAIFFLSCAKVNPERKRKTITPINPTLFNKRVIMSLSENEV